MRGWRWCGPAAVPCPFLSYVPCTQRHRRLIPPTSPCTSSPTVPSRSFPGAISAPYLHHICTSPAPPLHLPCTPLQLLASCAAVWRSDRLSRALASWKSARAAAVAAAAAATCSIARWRNATAAAALNTWRFEARGCGAMSRALCRWGDAARVSALLRWPGLLTLLSSLRGAAARWRLRQAAAAWRQWASVREEAEAARLRLRRAACRLLLGELARGFGSWRGWVDSPERGALSRAARRWCVQSLSRAVQQWHAASKMAEYTRARLRRGAGAWVRQAEACCWRAWREVVTRRMYYVASLRGAVGRWTSRRRCAAFLQWVRRARPEFSTQRAAVWASL